MACKRSLNLNHTCTCVCVCVCSMRVRIWRYDAACWIEWFFFLIFTKKTLKTRNQFVRPKGRGSVQNSETAYSCQYYFQTSRWRTESEFREQRPPSFFVYSVAEFRSSRKQMFDQVYNDKTRFCVYYKITCIICVVRNNKVCNACIK